MRAQVSFVLSQCTHRQTDTEPSQYRALHYMRSHGEQVAQLSQRPHCRVG